jgi:hypothetical protein
VGAPGLATSDGRFVEGASAEGHRLYPVAGGDPCVLSFICADETPVQWSSDGSLLYVVRAATWPGAAAQILHSLPAEVDRVDLRTGRRTLWKTLAPPDAVGVEAVNTVLVTPDGRSYCYGYLKSLNDLFVLNGLK